MQIPASSYRKTMSNRSNVHEMVALGYNPQQAHYVVPQTQAINQISELLVNRSTRIRVLELGVGGGTFCRKLLIAFPRQFEFTGVDVSQNKLDRAEKIVSMKTICASAAELESHLEGETFDLIIVHYLLAYVPLEKLLQSCAPLLAHNGALSIITSTNESMNDPHSDFRNVLSRLQRSWNPIRQYAAYAIKRGLKRNSTPDDITEVRGKLQQYKLTIQKCNSGRYPITLNTAAEAYKFCIADGWFTNAIPFERLPSFVVTSTIRQVMKFGHYPVRWPHMVDVVLATKG